jgi:hypothetical protein
MKYSQFFEEDNGMRLLVTFIYLNAIANIPAKV